MRNKKKQTSTQKELPKTQQKDSIDIKGVNVSRTHLKGPKDQPSFVAPLETSIRHSAKLTFWLNLLSCIMALVGFVSQVSDHREKDKKDREKYP